MSDMERYRKDLHDAEHCDRVMAGGAVCPKCGVKWDDARFTISPIRMTRIRRFFKDRPAFWCMECDYKWEANKISRRHYNR